MVKSKSKNKRTSPQTDGHKEQLPDEIHRDEPEITSFSQSSVSQIQDWEDQIISGDIRDINNIYYLLSTIKLAVSFTHSSIDADADHVYGDQQGKKRKKPNSNFNSGKDSEDIANENKPQEDRDHILEAIRNSTFKDISEDEKEIILAVIHALRRVFEFLDGKFPQMLRLDEATAELKSENERAVFEWIKDKIQEFHAYLTVCSFATQYKDLFSESIAVAVSLSSRRDDWQIGLRHILHRAFFPGLPNASSHSSINFKDEIRKLYKLQADCREILSTHFISKYVDVKIYCLQYVAEVCNSCASQSSKPKKLPKENSKEWNSKDRNVSSTQEEPSDHIVILHKRSSERSLLFDVLYQFLKTCEISLSDIKSQDILKYKHRKNPICNMAEEKDVNYVKMQQKVYQKAWIAFSTNSMPISIYKQVLEHLGKVVIPKLKSPLQLADFLTLAYNRGGEFSLLALEGLFVLIANHRLDYPLFFPKLYALLGEDHLFSSDAQNFMRLIPKFLRSGFLPLAMVAAFIKRLCRRAVLAPPHVALWCLRLGFELMRAHPSTHVLVHRIPENKSLNFFNMSATPENGQQSTKSFSSSSLPVFNGIDPYDDKEMDPVKSCASESCLWELEGLKKHYHPAVSRFVEIFKKDVRRQGTQAPTSLPAGTAEELSTMNYDELYQAEMKRKLKEPPLAYSKPSYVDAAEYSEGFSWR